MKLLGSISIVVLLLIGTSHASELSRTNLLEFTSRGRVIPVRSIANWKKRRAQILEAMQKVMGPLPAGDKRCALKVRHESKTDCDDYLRELISYESEPGSRVPAYLLVPKRPNGSDGKYPAVLALHQTHPLGQKVVVGLGHSTNDEYGVRLAKRGFVVLAPPYPLLADYNPDVKALGYQSGTMKAIWDNIRGLDLLESLPYVRTNGFGAIGQSLGGHNSIFTAVFDERIKVIVSSCGFDAFRDYMDGNIKGWTHIRYMPRLLDYTADTRPFDFHEMIGCLAPRWLYVNAPLHDSNFKWQSVEEVCAEARKVYQLYNASDHLAVQHPDAQHSFPPAQQEEAFNVLEQLLK